MADLARLCHSVRLLSLPEMSVPGTFLSRLYFSPYTQPFVGDQAKKLELNFVRSDLSVSFPW